MWDLGCPRLDGGERGFLEECKAGLGHPSGNVEQGLRFI